MNLNKISVYIAAPFFNQIQLARVMEIETILDKHGIKYFSPRSEGSIKMLPIEEREVASCKLYNLNISGMIQSDLMIALTDGYDPGTMFEVGFYSSMNMLISNKLQCKLFTITNENKGLNLMLKHPVHCHLTSADHLDLLLHDIRGTNTLEMERIIREYSENPEAET